ncbi:MAG: holo-ACP synthase [Bacteroidetes bacterium]|nr:holo-ACP synthase [Bacteroidota bacterium]
MVYGIGTDIIEVERVGGLVTKGPRFTEKVFTTGEIEYCGSKRHKNQHYAARFAAKEAFMKAIGTGWSQGISFNQIEVVHDSFGKPGFVLTGKAEEFVKEKGITSVQLSLSHVKEYAIAIVILET